MRISDWSSDVCSSDLWPHRRSPFYPFSSASFWWSAISCAASPWVRSSNQGHSDMTRIASHRGGTLEFGDITPQGFAATAAMALEEVEFDLHPTADGAIIVHHDPTLDATTDMTGAIADMTLAQVKAATIRYGAGSHPMTLEELCALYSGSTVNFRCEIKPGVDGLAYERFVATVIAMLEKHYM